MVPVASAAPGGIATSAYAPRRADETLLYASVAGHLESFLGRARARGRVVPRFVEREFRKFLECGIPAHGFMRVRCDDCGLDRIVPFSCKGRGFCTSCGGRRMADTAAHLVDRVLPRAPVRQWVLSLPVPLRYRLAYDAKLTGEVLALFVRAVFGSLRRRGGKRGQTGRLRCGAVTFVQRFGDALNLNVHFHLLAIDGTFDAGDDMRYRTVPPPDDDEVALVARRVARNLARLLERRGLGPESAADAADPLGADQPMLAALYAASVRGRVATGPRSGQRLLRFGDRVDADRLPECAGKARRCAQVGGVSIHANVSVPPNDRSRLERLCRYVARAPLASERLERGPGGRLLYRLRHRWRDGTTHMLFEPIELLERLAALVPPPRFNMVRYHGVFGPAAKRRTLVVPRDGGPSSHASTTHAACRGGGASHAPDPRDERRPRRYEWAELMRRVFAVDVFKCPRCAGTRRILAAIHAPTATRAILESLALPSRPPPVASSSEADPRIEEFD